MASASIVRVSFAVRRMAVADIFKGAKTILEIIIGNDYLTSIAEKTGMNLQLLNKKNSSCILCKSIKIPTFR